MNEEWRSVNDSHFCDMYKVSNLGRVYSNHRKRVLSPKKSIEGYLRITLCNAGFQKTYSVHRLVAMAFIPNPENKPTVNHKDECKVNNCINNLEWATAKEQNAYGTRSRRARANTDYNARKIDYDAVASKHDYKKTNMCNRKPCNVFYHGDFIGSFKTQREAAIFTNVSIGKVSQCVSGKKKSCKGYEFREIEEFPIAVTKKRFPE